MHQTKMARIKAQMVIRICSSHLHMIYRGLGGLLFWIPLLAAGYYLIAKLPGKFPLAPFLFFQVSLAPLFVNMFSGFICPQELKFYVMCGIDLKYVVGGKNGALMLLSVCGAILCGFGLQWKPFLTWQDSIHTLLYSFISIFPLLLAFNYVSVCPRLLRRYFCCYLLFFLTLGFTYVLYLVCMICLIGFKSYWVFGLVILLEVFCYCLITWFRVAPLAHRHILKVMEINDEMYRVYKPS